MAENLIQHVKSLEAEADVIVAEARTTARQIEQSASGEADSLRTEYEAGYGRDVDAFQAEQEQRVANCS